MISSPTPTSAWQKKFMVLADGENLVFRYQEMLGTRVAAQGVIHTRDVFVWHSSAAQAASWSPIRVNYYTSLVGGDDRISAVEETISKLQISRYREVHGQICPKVFKKPAQSRKTKLVDMSICIDALRHSFHRDVDAILLLSGDGDYLPLIREVMRNGTQVWLGAFSSGLSPKLRSAVDRFLDLDEVFFAKEDSKRQVHTLGGGR